MELSPEEKTQLQPLEKPKKKDTRCDLRSIIVLVVILLMAALAWGAITQTRLSNSQAKLSNTTASLVTTRAVLSNTTANLVTTKNDLDQDNSTLQLYQETLTAAGITIHSGVQPARHDLAGLPIILTRNPASHNPTYLELMSFILLDKTNTTPFNKPSYTCGDYARDLFNNAEAGGIRAGYVEVSFQGNPVGHSLDAFVTTDQGLLYIDSSGPELAPGQAGPANNDSTVVLKSGTEYQRQFILPQDGWVDVYWPEDIVDTIAIYW